MELDLRTELAVRGLRSAPPLQRRAGAGPSDDGHWKLGDDLAGFVTYDDRLSQAAARYGLTVIAPGAK